MLRRSRVAIVAGLVGALIALVVPFAVTPSAWALNDNVVSVTKVVNGTPAQLGNFEVVVTCDDGPGGQPAQVQTLTFAPTGGTQQAAFDPAFNQCTVVETQTRGADATSIQAVSPTAVIVVPNGNNATVPISITFDPGQQPPGPAQVANVGITNTFIPRNPNVVNVTKAVVGDAPAGAFFQIDVNCGGATVQLLFTAAGGTKPASFPSSDVGACTVVESLASPGLGPVPGLQQISYNPGQNLGAFTTGVGGGGTKAVTVTNRYASPGPLNTITVTKRVRGRAPAGVTGFRVQVTCNQTPGDPVNNPGTIQLANTFPATGGTFDFKVSKEYRDCDVVETPLPAGVLGVDYQATIAPGDGILRQNSGPNDVKLRFNTGGDHSAQVTVTNRYSGDNVLTITKNTLGQVPPGSLFLVRVACTNNFDGDPNNNTTPGPNAVPPNNNQPIDGYVFLLFGEGQPATQQIFDADGPNGTNDSCVVEETESGGASQVVYGATADAPDTILQIVQPPPGIGGVQVFWPLAQRTGDTAQVTITNRFTPCPNGAPKCTDPNGPIPTNSIRVKKRIRGDAPNPPSYTLKLRCSGGGVTEERLLTFTDQTAQTVEVPATRNNCVLKETESGGASSVEYFANSATADATFGNNSARVEFGTTGGESARLRVTNRYSGSCPPGPPKFC
jgi:hypothetical protein